MARVPWTPHHQHRDHETPRPASQCKPLEYPKLDRKLTFGRLLRVFNSSMAGVPLPHWGYIFIKVDFDLLVDDLRRGQASFHIVGENT